MKRILIIDDNLLIRKQIRFILRDEDFDIEEAENGIQGLEMIKQETYDLIVTDIIMPEMEGLELILRLKRDFPKIKIIAISGGKPYYLYMAKKFGVQNVFTKPIDHQKLLTAIKNIIQFSEKFSNSHRKVI